MSNYSHLKTGKFYSSVLVLCVSCAIMLPACGAKKAVVSDKKPVPGRVSKDPLKPLIDMVLVSGGKFIMGNPVAGDTNRRDKTTISNDEWPNHEVTLRDFYIGKYEVTQGQYLEVTDMKPSSFSTSNEDKGPDGWMKLPVESINWYDTLVFCNKLSIKEKLKPVYSINGSVNPDDWGEPPTRRSTEWDAVKMDTEANGYRLPTEAEWEYAARGGAESKGYNYAGSNTVSEVSWYSVRNTSGGPPVGSSHEVGKKQPNELGLYDMSGNVMEWCWDWFDRYSADAQNNPIGPSRGTHRVIRGGGWSAVDWYGRTLYRHSNFAYYIGVDLGFRVVRNK